MEFLGLLDFLSNYYHMDAAEIRKLIVWICSNFTILNKFSCMNLVQSPIFHMIINSIAKETKTKVIEEIFYMIMNILTHLDTEISFSFLNYNFMQNLIELYYANAENWKSILHIYIINLFKFIFKIENQYRFEEEKNYNFDDNNLNFVEYFLRQGGLDFLSNLRNKQSEQVNKQIDELENEINKRLNYHKYN